MNDTPDANNLSRLNDSRRLFGEMVDKFRCMSHMGSRPSYLFQDGPLPWIAKNTGDSTLHHAAMPVGIW